ncbi:MAG: hypothetical protein ACRENP_09570 [Longimicrobiales bacterium]
MRMLIPSAVLLLASVAAMRPLVGQESVTQLTLMSSRGENARQLTGGQQPVGWPSWTPDGRTIAFNVRTERGHRLQRLELASARVSALHDDGVQDFRPSVSANGRALLFDRFGASVPANHDIFVRDMQSGVVTQLTSDPGYDSDARWSPDGTRIVFHSDRGADRQYATQVYVMGRDGSGVRRLTDGPAVHAYPSWSPDGRYLAYTSELAGNRDVWIMRVDDGACVRVTDHQGFDGDPVWAPNGEQLLFSTDRFGGQELALVDVVALLRSLRPTESMAIRGSMRPAGRATRGH